MPPLSSRKVEAPGCVQRKEIVASTPEGLGGGEVEVELGVDVGQQDGALARLGEHQWHPAHPSDGVHGVSIGDSTRPGERV